VQLVSASQSLEHTYTPYKREFIINGQEKGDSPHATYKKMLTRVARVSCLACGVARVSCLACGVARVRLRLASG